MQIVEPDLTEVVVFEDMTDGADSKITPIYPVRYGYAGVSFSADPAGEPPPQLHKFFPHEYEANAKRERINRAAKLDPNTTPSISGYITGPVREGWIYIREESKLDGDSIVELPTEQDFIHIFKCVREEYDGQGVKDWYIKYEFGESRSQLVPEKIYPFLFVRGDRRKLSIAYSEHPWTENIIFDLHRDRNKRARCMQQFLLLDYDERQKDDWSTRSVVMATEQNFEYLAGFYDRSRMLSKELQAKIAYPNVSEEYPDPMAPRNVKALVSNVEALASIEEEDINFKPSMPGGYLKGDGERGYIIGLYDPVGVQKEIARAHAHLAHLIQYYIAANRHPHIIGSYVEKILSSRSMERDEQEELIEDALNGKAYIRYWTEIKHTISWLEKAQNKLIEDFSFYLNSENWRYWPRSYTRLDRGSYGVGLLHNYVKYFFDTSLTTPEESKQELIKIIEVTTGAFDSIASSGTGEEALELAFSHTTSDGDDSTLKRIYKAFETYVLHPKDYPEIDKKLTDWLTQFANTLAKAVAQNEVLAKVPGALTRAPGVIKTKLSPATIKQITNGFLPAIYKIFGIEVSSEVSIDMTFEQAESAVVQSMQNKASGNEKPAKISNPFIKWLREKSTRVFKFKTVKVKKTSPYTADDFVKVGESRIGFVVSGGMTGLSLYFNLQAMYSFIYQSAFLHEFDKADPLAQDKNPLYEVISFCSITSAIIADGLAIKQLVSGTAANVSKPSSALISRVFIVANVAGAIKSVWDAVSAFDRGDTTEGIGHTSLAVSNIFFITGSIGALKAAKFTLLLTAFSWLAFGLFILGFLLVIFFRKTPIEKLIYYGFWGQSDEYRYWSSSLPRLDINNMLRVARTIDRNPTLEQGFHMEMQEYSNMFFMPKLHIYSPRKVDPNGFIDFERPAHRDYVNTGEHHFTFTLPYFQRHLSQIHGDIYKDHKFRYLHKEASDALREKISLVLSQKPSKDTKSYNSYSIDEGILTLKVSINLGFATGNIHLLWAYAPRSDVLVPRRMELSDDDGHREWKGGMHNDEKVFVSFKKIMRS